MLQSPPQTVQRWALWEITVPNTRGYSNPFTDVALHATFIAPSGRRITVSGFYDGEQRWRVRWMPDETGHWRYEMRFSDDSARATGGFRCTPGKLHGPLRVRKQNPLWFEHADGTPFYMRAFHLWNIDVLDERTLNSTLDWLKKQGFNTIVGPHLHPQHPVPRLPWEQKRDGQIDFTRFHLPLWQNMDRALRALSVRGMVLALRLRGNTFTQQEADLLEQITHHLPVSPPLSKENVVVLALVHRFAPLAKRLRGIRRATLFER
jgi:hypothetical protein